MTVAGILAVLLAKNNRLDSIFGSTKLQVKAHTDLDILKVVIGVCLVQILLLGFFSGPPLSRPQLTLGKGSLSDELVYQCSQESGFMSWLGAEIAFIAALMLASAYLGFRTRNLPSQYNESTHIQNAVILLIFFGIIIVPLDIFIQDSPEASVLIQGLGQAFLCLTLTAIMFGPKLYYIASVPVVRVVEKSDGGANDTRYASSSPMDTHMPTGKLASTTPATGAVAVRYMTPGQTKGSIIGHGAGGVRASTTLTPGSAAQMASMPKRLPMTANPRINRMGQNMNIRVRTPGATSETIDSRAEGVNATSENRHRLAHTASHSMGVDNLDQPTPMQPESNETIEVVNNEEEVGGIRQSPTTGTRNVESEVSNSSSSATPPLINGTPAIDAAGDSGPIQPDQVRIHVQS